MADWCAVRSFLFRHEAALVGGVLEANGILCRIAADDLGGWRPELAIGQGGYRLMVPAALLRDADELLTAYEAEPEEVP
ncbi:MAG: hypothetical protein HZB16_18150 [Armatimonadetes bacterium]|nr:hypothetical protein [Armatimonadota bacterium]